MILRRRRVRIHQERDLPTIEGVLVGTIDRHYRLLQPKILHSTDQTYDLKNPEAWVPRERVVFLEVIR